MLMTRDEAQQILATAKRTVNNRRAYAHHGAVWYPIATLVWVANTGEWPHSTPRHLDGDPSNNDFSNLRKPGRAKATRKTVRETMAAATAPAITRAPEQPAPQSLFV